MKLIDFTLTQFLNEVDSSSPAPGGGSVSALASVLGLCLAKMVSHLTFNKKIFLELEEDVRKEYEANFNTLNNIKEELLPLIDKDTESFNMIMKAYGLPKETEEERLIRSESIQLATLEAIKTPFEIVKLSYKALEVIEKMLTYGNRNALSDIGVGSLLIATGLEGAVLNVKINLSSLKDQEKVLYYQQEVSNILEESKKIKERILLYVYQNI
ncbi:MAG TPA: cyclodeaminase/cyclohydrolase family protein [Haloplasmataceae bacterium]